MRTNANIDSERALEKGLTFFFSQHETNWNCKVNILASRRRITKDSMTIFIDTFTRVQRNFAKNNSRKILLDFPYGCDIDVKDS